MTVVQVCCFKNDLVLVENVWFLAGYIVFEK